MTDLHDVEHPDDGGEWISVSDLMAGLMLIFLFIAIVYIRVQVAEKERAIEKTRELAQVQSQVQEIVVTWQRSSERILDALHAEFEDDLPRWNAEIVPKDITIRFKAPEVLFDRGTAALKPEFEVILDDFFPRYLDVLSRHLDVIEEVRIEGHSSSEWMDGMEPLDAFFENMRLSQDRTRTVLRHSLQLEAVEPNRAWATAKVTANGLSSSRLVLSDTGEEDREASRRVEFKVRTKTEQQIVRILETMQ